MPRFRISRPECIELWDNVFSWFDIVWSWLSPFFCDYWKHWPVESYSEISSGQTSCWQLWCGPSQLSPLSTNSWSVGNICSKSSIIMVKLAFSDLNSSTEFWSIWSAKLVWEVKSHQKWYIHTHYCNHRLDRWRKLWASGFHTQTENGQILRSECILRWIGFSATQFWMNFYGVWNIWPHTFCISGPQQHFTSISNFDLAMNGKWPLSYHLVFLMQSYTSNCFPCFYIPWSILIEI